jgi:preprotein translocase subunit SecY
MWLGERITDKGIGNGISLLIMIGIIAQLPQSFLQEYVKQVVNPEEELLFSFWNWLPFTWSYSLPLRSPKRCARFLWSMQSG